MASPLCSNDRMETISQTYILHITIASINYLNLAISRLHKELYKGIIYMKVMDKSSALQKMQVTSDHRPRKCFYNIYHTFVTGVHGTKTAINQSCKHTQLL